MTILTGGRNYGAPKFESASGGYLVPLTGNTAVQRVFDLVRDDLAKVEEEFGRQAVSGVQPITEIGQYLKNGGGKRLRPALVLLASKLCGYTGPAAVRLGAVMEMIHTAT